MTYFPVAVSKSFDGTKEAKFAVPTTAATTFAFNETNYGYWNAINQNMGTNDTVTHGSLILSNGSFSVEFPTAAANVTFSAANYGFWAAMDQDVSNSANVVFGTTQSKGALTVGDGIQVIFPVPTTARTFAQSHYDNLFFMQPVATTDSVSFAGVTSTNGLTVSTGNLSVSGTGNIESVGGHLKAGDGSNYVIFAKPTSGQFAFNESAYTKINTMQSVATSDSVTFAGITNNGSLQLANGADTVTFAAPAASSGVLNVPNTVYQYLAAMDQSVSTTANVTHGSLVLSNGSFSVTFPTASANVTFTTANYGFWAAMDQDVSNGASPTFATTTSSTSLVVGGGNTVTFSAPTTGARTFGEADYARWDAMDQNLETTASPTFVNVTISGTPSNSTDAANVQYVQDVVTGAIDGLRPKEAVMVATTAALNTYTFAANVLTSTTNVVLTIDGQDADGTNLKLNDRVLVKDEIGANEKYNGIYYISQLGVASTTPWKLTRATDANAASEFTIHTYTLVLEGSTLKGSSWVVSAAPSTLNTDAISYVQFSSSAASLGGTNVGTGQGVFKGVNGNNLEFYELLGTSNYIDLTLSTDDIVFDIATGPKQTLDRAANIPSLVTTSSWNNLVNSNGLTISATEWGFLYVMDQSVATGASPTFVDVTVSSLLPTTTKAIGASGNAFTNAYVTTVTTNALVATGATPDIGSSGTPFNHTYSTNVTSTTMNTTTLNATTLSGNHVGNVQEVTGSATPAVATNYVIVNAASVATITLPSGHPNGHLMLIKRTGAANVTVDAQTTASTTIDGSNTYVLTSQYECITLLKGTAGYHLV